MRRLLQKLRIFPIEPLGNKCVPHDALLEENFIPHACAKVFAGEVRVMAVHLEFRAAILLLLPLPAHVKRMALIGQLGLLGGFGVECRIGLIAPLRICVCEVKRIADWIKSQLPGRM